MAERSVDLVVTGGRVVTPSEVLETDIAIRDGRIAALGPAALLPPAEWRLDAAGQYVLPGLIDCHVHLGPVYDDWRTGSLAAAHGGLTTVLSFVEYDAEARETLPRALERLREEAGAQSVVDFGFHFILNHQPYILDGLADVFRQGVTSFKLFMTYKRRPYRMCPDDFIARAMERIAALGGLCQLHCENGDVLSYLEEKAIAEGRVRPTDFPATCPGWAEEEAINRAIKLGAMTGCPVYVVHLSTALGLERIKQAQAAGQAVWTETCPQYLLLTEREMETWGPFAKIGPPLRPADGPDREALWRGSAQGYIATVASDHAPRPKAAKEPGWKNIFVDEHGRPIPFGSPGLETLVPLMWSEGVVRRGLSPCWLARVMAENPARLFGLYPRKGAIRVGADADLTIIDPSAEWTVTVADHKSIAGWTLFEGWKVRGRVRTTLLRGEVLLDDGKVTRPPGSGRFLARGRPMAPLGVEAAAAGR
ncbi:MAG TPA: amidohydrolase family protein [Candidatus Binatia bacterium]|nr:amidohydrolase family protein [Candidatus Binatia bacterium]